MAHGHYHPHRLPTRETPETLTSATKYFAAANGASIELVAHGIRYFEDGEEHREVTGYSALLDNGDGITATVYLNQDGDETPETFSELEAYPEHHGGQLEAACNEICDGHTQTARAFDDALTALKREFDN